MLDLHDFSFQFLVCLLKVHRAGTRSSSTRCTVRYTRLVSLLIIGALMLASFDWRCPAQLKVEKLLALFTIKFA